MGQEKLRVPEQAPEKSFLKRYARELLVIAAFGIGGMLLQDSQEPIANNDDNKFSMEPIKKLFDAEWRQSGKQYLVHLGQFHGQHTLAQIEAVPRTKAAIIAAQKNVEQALLYLQKIYGVREVFVEGVTADAEKLFKEEDEAASKFKLDLAAGRLQESAQSLCQWLNNYEFKLKTKDYLFDEGAAIGGYFLYCRLNELFAALAGEKDPGVINNETLVYLTSAKEKLAVDPLITGDQVYLWGAAEKLRGEHLLTIRSAEDKTLVDRAEKAVRAMIHKDAVGELSKQDIEAIIKLQNEREDEAIKRAFRLDEKGVNLKVIVYGNAHDFSGNLKRAQVAGLAKGFGMLKLSNKEKVEWDKIKEEELPEFHQPSLEDKR